MRHRISGKKFGRNSKHRKAMFRNLVSQLFVHERIVTTDTKAKELRIFAERLITKAKSLGELLTQDYKELSHEDKMKHVNMRRLVAKSIRSWMGDKKDNYVDVVGKLFTDIAPRFMDRAGGYTRIIKLGIRRNGDNAPISIIELVEKGEDFETPKPEAKTKTTKGKKKAVSETEKTEKKVTKKRKVKAEETEESEE